MKAFFILTLLFMLFVACGRNAIPVYVPPDSPEYSEDKVLGLVKDWLRDKCHDSSLMFHEGTYTSFYNGEGLWLLGWKYPKEHGNYSLVKWRFNERYRNGTLRSFDINQVRLTNPTYDYPYIWQGLFDTPWCDARTDVRKVLKQLRLLRTLLF